MRKVFKKNFCNDICLWIVNEMHCIPLYAKWTTAFSIATVFITVIIT
jgi:hypothetical protein